MKEGNCGDMSPRLRAESHSDTITTIAEEEEEEGESTLDNTPSPVRGGLNISNISKISPVRETKVTPGRRKMTPIKEGTKRTTPVKERRTTPVKRVTPLKEKRGMFEDSKENVPENELDLSPIYSTVKKEGLHRNSPISSTMKEGSCGNIVFNRAPTMKIKR